MMKKTKLTDQLRKAIDTCGKTRYQIAKETGIDQATLSRFMYGKGGLSMEGLDIIGQALGLRIVADEAQTTKGRK